ncbi:MAG: VanZ family protein [Desulfobacterales bacterium]
MQKLNTFIIYWFPLIVYCIFIFIQSAHPTPDLIPPRPFLDKMLHFLAYAVMGILFTRAYRTLRFKTRPHLLIVLSITSSILYGVSDEIHQHFIPWRQADLMDGFADALGSVFGVLLYHFIGVKNRHQTR